MNNIDSGKACEIVQDLLPLYYDGVCSEESRLFVEEHLKMCDDCRGMLDSLKNDVTEKEIAADAQTVLRHHAQKEKNIALMTGMIIAGVLIVTFMMVSILNLLGWINFWGAIVVIVMLIPNIIFEICNPHSENKCKNTAMNVIEQIGRYASMILMILPIGVWKFGFHSVFEMLLCFFTTVAMLIAYLAVWIFYFKSQSFSKAMALAVLPTFIFLMNGILLRHWLLVIAAILFGVGHIYVTLQNKVAYG